MIVNRTSVDFYAKRQSGGKGYNLYLLSKAGFNVPEWVVFGTRFFQEHIQSNNLVDRINQFLENFLQGQSTADMTEAQVLESFLASHPTEALRKSVREALKALPQGLVSVRSSAADEDGVSHSFAGQLSSFLYVSPTEEEVLLNIKKCWASGFSARGLVYRRERKLDFKQISVAVVLQRMIDPDKSGVLFTADPITKDLNQMLISSVYGVGEGLVSGALEADSFWVENSTQKLLRSEIVTKTGAMRRSASGACHIDALSSEKQQVASLNDIELRKLTELGQKIFAHFNLPQDIEWAIENDKVYLLQTRPITHLETDLVGYPNLWDNSNIIESYGGLTSPLSFSFALRNYKAVYVQFCEVLGVPSRVIKEMDTYLSHMLGCLNGRVYYNLFNWYKLVGVLPGFKQNREFMETMMGVSQTLSAEIADRIQPHPSWNTFSGRLRKIVSGFNFFRFHLTIQSMVDKFLETFNRDYDRYRAMPLKQMRGDQLIQIYYEIEQNMLGRWHAPIINDFLCMVHFGVLRKLTLKWLSDLDSTIQNDLLSGEGGLESAEPMNVMKRLAQEVARSKELSALFEATANIDLLEALQQSPQQDFFAKIIAYVDKYGFRCMSEMKLEEIDLATDPTYLFVCIKNYLKAPDLLQPQSEDHQSLRKTAEEKVKTRLQGLRKLTYFWFLKHARKAVKNRENTRFARTRIYGVARSVFQVIGAELHSLNIIESPRDIFWLSIEEVGGIYNGTLASYDLKPFVEIRKKSYAGFTEETDARIMTRGPVYWRNSFQQPFVAEDFSDQTFHLKGLPCCPGLVEGIVKVISSPQDDLTLNGEILVADRTDPGWIPLYPSISGLLVERGSLLSHSAIVAREMSIPTIVSIPGLMRTLKTGMRVRLDGKAGTITILDGESQ